MGSRRVSRKMKHINFIIIHTKELFNPVKRNRVLTILYKIIIIKVAKRTKIQILLNIGSAIVLKG